MTERAKRLLGWIGWAGTDAAGRLVLLSGSTILLSRLSSPRDFGVAALVLTIVTMAAVFVGAPFEEALTQLPRLHSRHLSAALGASWSIAALLLALTLWVAAPLAKLYDAPDIGVLLPVAMISIFFSGHSDVIAALARRRRRFNELVYATLAGHVAGVALSLVVAAMGHALWALVLQRLSSSPARSSCNGGSAFRRRRAGRSPLCASLRDTRAFRFSPASPTRSLIWRSTIWCRASKRRRTGPGEHGDADHRADPQRRHGDRP